MADDDSGRERFEGELTWSRAPHAPVYGLNPGAPPPDLQAPQAPPPVGHYSPAEPAPAPGMPSALFGPPAPAQAAPPAYSSAAPLFFGPALTPDQRAALLQFPPSGPQP